MTEHRRRSSSTHRTPQPASSTANSPCAHTIELFAPNRDDDVIPMDAFHEIQHHFPHHLMRPQANVPLRQDLDYIIRLQGDTVAIQTRAPFHLKKRLEEAGYPARLPVRIWQPPMPSVSTT